MSEQFKSTDRRHGLTEEQLAEYNRAYAEFDFRIRQAIEGVWESHTDDRLDPVWDLALLSAIDRAKMVATEGLNNRQEALSHENPSAQFPGLGDDW